MSTASVQGTCPGTHASTDCPCKSTPGFPGGSVVKNLPANTGDAWYAGLMPELGESPGGGNGNLLQYSCLENSMDRGAWRATVCGVTKSQAWLSTCTHTHTHTHTHIIITYTLDIVALQSPNHVRLLATPCIAACQASLSLLISWDLPKFMFIELVMPSKHLILCLLLLSVFLSSGYFPMSQLFVSGDQSIGASDSALVLPVSIQGWFSLRLDWFELFAVQGTLKSLL